MEGAASLFSTDDELGSLYKAITGRRMKATKPSRRKGARHVGRPARDWPAWLLTNPALRRAVSIAAGRFDLTLTDILAHTRPAHLVIARQGAVYVLSRFKLNLPELAAIFDRNHATIIYSLRLATKAVKENKKLSKKLNAIVLEVEPLLHQYAERPQCKAAMRSLTNGAAVKEPKE